MGSKMSTIDLCREFYLTEVAPMISRDFPEYEARIAAGVAGEGSDCFGYDDEISRDHDFGIGVCLWLTDDDYARIGEKLSGSYRNLADRQPAGSRLDYRRGVQRTSDFYRKALGFDVDIETPGLSDAQWFYAEDHKLATAVNGEVFRDDLGQFTGVRNLIMGHYPDRIFRMKLANALHGYAGAWQANYPRCMARKDNVAAMFCISKGTEEAMKIAALLSRTYLPYYKWTYRALCDLGDRDKNFEAIAKLLDRASVTASQADAWNDHTYDPRIINTEDELVVIGEEIAGYVVKMLRERGLTTSGETFLEAHCEEIARGVRQKSTESA